MPQKQKKPRKPLIYQGLRGFCTLFPLKEQKGTENRELTKLCDWLLPMLMNGQATVE
jgi:hypothetical protein